MINIFFFLAKIRSNKKVKEKKSYEINQNYLFLKKSIFLFIILGVKKCDFLSKG